MVRVVRFTGLVEARSALPADVVERLVVEMAKDEGLTLDRFRGRPCDGGGSSCLPAARSPAGCRRALGTMPLAARTAALHAGTGRPRRFGVLLGEDFFGGCGRASVVATTGLLCAQRDWPAPAGSGRQDRSAAARRGWPGVRSGFVTGSVEWELLPGKAGERGQPKIVVR